MKIYAVVTTPEELREKLFQWYQRQAELKMGLANTILSVKEKDRYHAQSATYLHIAAELMEMVITQEIGNVTPVGVVL